MLDRVKLSEKLQISKSPLTLLASATYLIPHSCQGLKSQAGEIGESQGCKVQQDVEVGSLR